MLQTGTVIVFKPGTTKEQIRAVIESIEPIIDYYSEPQEFDPEYGGPVWYIP